MNGARYRCSIRGRESLAEALDTVRRGRSSASRERKAKAQPDGPIYSKLEARKLPPEDDGGKLRRRSHRRSPSPVMPRAAAIRTATVTQRSRSPVGYDKYDYGVVVDKAPRNGFRETTSLKKPNGHEVAVDRTQGPASQAPPGARRQLRGGRLQIRGADIDALISAVVRNGHKEKPSLSSGHKVKPSLSNGHKVKPSLSNGHKEKPCFSNPYITMGNSASTSVSRKRVAKTSHEAPLRRGALAAGSRRRGEEAEELLFRTPGEEEEEDQASLSVEDELPAEQEWIEEAKEGVTDACLAEPPEQEEEELHSEGTSSLLASEAEQEDEDFQADGSSDADADADAIVDAIVETASQASALPTSPHAQQQPASSAPTLQSRGPARPPAQEPMSPLSRQSAGQHAAQQRPPSPPSRQSANPYVQEPPAIPQAPAQQLAGQRPANQPTDPYAKERPLRPSAGQLPASSYRQQPFNPSSRQPINSFSRQPASPSTPQQVVTEELGEDTEEVDDPPTDLDEAQWEDVDEHNELEQQVEVEEEEPEEEVAEELVEEMLEQAEEPEDEEEVEEEQAVEEEEPEEECAEADAENEEEDHEDSDQRWPKRGCVKRRKQLCKFYAEGRCKRGRFCIWAHGEHELELAPANMRLEKTRICVHHENGWCAQGNCCPFAHGAEELKQGRRGSRRGDTPEIAEKSKSSLVTIRSVPDAGEEQEQRPYVRAELLRPVKIATRAKAAPAPRRGAELLTGVLSSILKRKLAKQGL